jgi:hypothetical protein
MIPYDVIYHGWLMLTHHLPHVAVAPQPGRNGHSHPKPTAKPSGPDRHRTSPPGVGRMRMSPMAHLNRLNGLYRLLVILATAMSVEIQHWFDTPRSRLTNMSTNVTLQQLARGARCVQQNLIQHPLVSHYVGITIIQAENVQRNESREHRYPAAHSSASYCHELLAGDFSRIYRRYYCSQGNSVDVKRRQLA